MKTKLNFKSIALIILSLLAVLAACSLLISGTRSEKAPEKPDVELPEITVGSDLTPTNGYISFLGDSITTYEGWSNNADYNSTIGENGVYYDSSKMDVTDTWWHQVAKEAGYGLCVNNSWDGARVTGTKEGIPSGPDRASKLHNDNLGIRPDVIIVYLGTNDLANGIDAGYIGDNVGFSSFLDVMLCTIDSNYPDAEVYVCTLLPESRTEGREVELQAYNEVIKDVTELNYYNVIDLYTLIPDWDYTTDTFVDGTLRVHPTAEGMDKITEAVLSVIQSEG